MMLLILFWTKKTQSAERGLVYADIGQSSFNQLQHPQPSIPALEDTPIEYARINHKSLLDKKRNSPITFNGTIPIASYCYLKHCNHFPSYMYACMQGLVVVRCQHFLLCMHNIYMQMSHSVLIWIIY